MATAAAVAKIPAPGWDEEIARLADELPRLAPAAKEAVRGVLAALLYDPALDPWQAREARALLRRLP